MAHHHHWCNRLPTQFLPCVFVGIPAARRIDDFDCQDSRRKEHHRKNQQIKIPDGEGSCPRVCFINHVAQSVENQHAIYRPIALDGEPHVETYNSELKHLAQSGRDTWFTAPWLYADYGLIALIVDTSLMHNPQVLPVSYRTIHLHVIGRHPN